MGFWIPFFAIGFSLAISAYILARRLQLMAIVDLVWTLGLGISGFAYAATLTHGTLRAWLIASVLGIWSLRLSYHLFSDRVLPGHEDPRYQALAAKWEDRSPRNFLGLFLVQVLFVALFLLPVSVAMESSEPLLQVSDGLGLLIAVMAIVGQATADRQLARFRGDSQHSGQVCHEGLWRYSRHPNYFCEWLFWWCFVAFAWGSPNWWVSLFGPAAMYCFLRYLTGIPHAERSSLKSRGEAYRLYQKTTNAFFPWLPRKIQN
ncbi:DUF1295 domain-containing protein [Coraliomargarita sp. W4R53]